MTEEELRQLGVSLLNSPAEAIVYSDREGLIRLWNAGAERVFGFTAEEALGQSLDIIIPERQRQRHWEGYDEVMKTGVSRYGSGDLLSVPALRKDGSRISVEFTIVPLKDADGAILGMASVMRDVSARFEELKTLRRQAAGR